MSESDVPYNPLDKRRLGENVAEALLRRDPICFDDLHPFDGAGIYAIYYTGKFAIYRPLAEANRGGRFRVPIYVGKAVLSGGRKGVTDLEAPSGPALFRRLREHGESVEQAGNLEFSEFHFRHLVVDDIWIPLGESLLIQRFLPVWNLVVDGFGNHDPGSGRYNQKKSVWDLLHPGREWAEKCQPCPKSLDEVSVAVRKHLERLPPSERIGSSKS